MSSEHQQRNKAYYDRNAERYEDASWYYFNRYKNSEVVRELGVAVQAIGKPALRVLEIGPGTGYLLDKLLKLVSGELRYTGIEHSAAMAKILKERFAGRCATLQIVEQSVGTESLEPILLHQEFDLIMGSSILHHLEDYESVVRRLAAAVAPGGVLYFVREPIHRQECVPVGRATVALESFYSGVNQFLFRPTLRKLLWPGKVKAEDASGIAIHMFGDGVSTAAFRGLCAGEFVPLFERKYNRRLSGLLSYLENKWLACCRQDIFGNTLFSIAIQRKKND